MNSILACQSIINAYRHAMWSACLVYIMGRSTKYAKLFADVHEAECLNDPTWRANSEMDLANNATGQEIGRVYYMVRSWVYTPMKWFGGTYSITSDPYADLSAIVQDFVKRGKLTWIR